MDVKGQCFWEVDLELDQEAQVFAFCDVIRGSITVTYFCAEESVPIKVVLGSGIDIDYFAFESLTSGGLEINNTGAPGTVYDPNLPDGHQTDWITIEGDDYEPTIVTYDFILRPTAFNTNNQDPFLPYSLSVDIYDQNDNVIAFDVESGNIDNMFLVSGNLSNNPVGLPLQGQSFGHEYFNAIVIDQQLIVDVPGNYFMRRQPNQGERILKLNAGASIEVEDGSHLIIDGFIIGGCDEMWENILVKDGGRLTLRNCVVLDGERAVDVEEGGRVTLNDTRFVNNWAALDIRNTFPIQGNSATASIRRCIFEGVGTLKAPRENEIPWAGILAVDLPSLSLPHQQGNSVFSNMHNGVIAINTNLVSA